MRLFTTISTKLANTRGTFSPDRKKNCPLTTRENIGGGGEEGRGRRRRRRTRSREDVSRTVREANESVGKGWNFVSW